MNDLFLLEVDDARALIRDMRGDPNAFDFQLQIQRPSRYGSPSGFYTVVVDLDGQYVHYQGGYGLDWVGHFEFDLCRGLFGRKFNKTE